MTDAITSRNDLPSLFLARGYRTGAEIGVWEGHFSRRLCVGIPGLKLLCVDPWQWSPDYAADRKNDQARLDRAYRTAVETLRGFDCTIAKCSSLVAADQVPDRSLDFVYIDANHAADHVAADLQAWAPKVRVGGIVAGHDYVTRSDKPWLQVKPVVDAYVRAHHISLHVLAADKSPSFYWVVAHA